MSTAFVAGATGYTGREVVRILASRGVETHAHVRPDSSKLGEWTERFTAMGAKVDATPWDLSAMTATIARVRPTEVFALLGTTQKRARAAGARGEKADYEAVDYGLSVMLLKAVLASGVRPRFVYLSSAGVSPTSSSAYMSARARVEAEVAASGLSYAFARPSFITGEDRDEARPGERFGAAVTDGLLAVVGVFGGRKLKERYRSTTNTALAEALVRIALDPSTGDRVFESEELRG